MGGEGVEIGVDAPHRRLGPSQKIDPAARRATQYSGLKAGRRGCSAGESSNVDFDSSEAAAAVDSPWPLVGRDAVRERALTALRGLTRTVALHGASGVGKSRLAAEVVADLEQDGWISVGVAGNAGVSALPLTTLAPVLTRDASGPIISATDVAGLFAAASASLTEIVRGRRVVVVLEEACFADAVSVSLIAELVHAGDLRIVATLAEGDPVPESIVGIAAEPDAVRIDLPALDADQTAELLELVLGAPVALPAVAELHRASSGNPLFLRELVIRTWQAGTLIRAPDHWRLTGGTVGSPLLQDLIRVRMRTLTPEERDAVERLALCQPLALSEFARPGAPEALADLEQRDLVRVQEVGASMRVRLTHPRYATAVRESIPRIRRQAILREQADLVAARSPSPAEELRVALWRLDAGQPLAPALLLRSARLAQQAGNDRIPDAPVPASVGTRHRL